MSWFYIAIGTAVVAAMLDLNRLGDLMLAVAVLIGYLDSLPNPPGGRP